jgi:hypothetical protein
LQEPPEETVCCDEGVLRQIQTLIVLKGSLGQYSITHYTYNGEAGVTTPAAPAPASNSH